MKLHSKGWISTQFRSGLLALVGLMTFGLLGLLVLGYFSASGATDLYQRHLRPLLLLNTVSESYSTTITSAMRAVRSGRLDPAEGIRKIRAANDSALTAWRSFKSWRGSDGVIAEVDAHLEKIQRLLPEMEKLLPLGISRELGSFGDHHWLPQVTSLVQGLEQVRLEQDRTARELITALEARLRWGLILGAALTVVALGLSIYLGNHWTRRVQSGVEALCARLRMVADRATELPEQATEEDELAYADRILNVVLRRLQDLMEGLRAQEAFQRAMLEGAEAAIIGLDTDGKVNRWNRAAQQMIGYSAEEVIGKATPALWRPAEELEHLARALTLRLGRPVAGDASVMQVAASLPDFSIECHYRHRDGHLTPVLLAVSQVRTPEGDLLGTMGVALNLTQMKALEADLRESESRYRLLAERLPDVVFQMKESPEGRRTWPFISPQFRTLFGADPGLLKGRPSYLLDKMHPEDRPGYLLCQEKAARRLEPLEWEGRFYTERPDEVKWIRERRSPTRLADGSVLWDGVAQDITHLKRAEEQLRLSEARALGASRAKSAFLANMSHELRTPLSVILGYAGLLAGDAERSDSDRAQLEKIQRAGEHLLTLINDVLALTKIEAGRMEVHRVAFDPCRLGQDLETMFHLTATSRGLGFSVEFRGFPGQVEGDLPKLRQVLVNLLGNAFKFTESGRVNLHATWEAGFATFQVEDTGPGISPEDQAQLFQAFQQTERGMSVGGTGLGLHISQSIVTLMDGRLELQSEPGRGSRFGFRVPLPASEQIAIVPAVRGRRAIASGKRSPRLLLVDDRPENRDILKRLLERAGFTCTEAVDGADGVGHWEAEQPDLVLMDLRMPIMDGFQAVELIRCKERDRGGARTPVVAISASVYDVTIESLKAQGFDDFLTKPVQEDRLLESLGRLLSIEYVEVTAKTAFVGASLAPLKNQPSEWLDRFRDQVVMGDLEGAEKILEELPATGFREAVRHHLRTYNLKELLSHL